MNEYFPFLIHIFVLEDNIECSLTILIYRLSGNGGRKADESE